jgi:mono/diheme cytochrome c family protein
MRKLARSFATPGILSATISLILFPGIAQALQETAKPVKTVLDGAFAAGQAARGRAAYQDACSRCHGEALQGHVGGYGGGADAPMLTGKIFIDRWREDNLVELFTVIRAGMPRQAVDSVSTPAKLDILAYILQVSGFPSGREELTADSLSSTRLVGLDGPKPLPSDTTVLTVGCLAKGADNVWVLTQAAEPLRTYRPDETSAEELKSSSQIGLGNLSFKLPSLDFAIPGVRPGPFQGHKVQIKGLVHREPNNDRITVRSMKSLAASCVAS